MQKLTAKDLKKLFLYGAAALDAEKAWINELNVFPVPDGDTGTNMTMTIMSAAGEIMKADENSMTSVTKAISSGALKGARGNSGVILSQLLRGFCKTVQEYEELNVEILARACKKASETAYKAVMSPKEGTILTVARAMAEKAVDIADEQNMEVFIDEILKAGDEMLLRTPEMLPVLKQAGVVDSGGQGLMVIMHAVQDSFLGNEKEFEKKAPAAPSDDEHRSVDVSNLETSDIKFGYCTEFIIMLEKKFTDEDEKEMKTFLTSIGDSLVCVADDEVVKIHVHTNDPGLAIQKALSYGQLTRMKIDNMREEHQERLFNASEIEAAQKEGEPEFVPAAPEKPLGFVAVCSGDGLGQIFRELGCDQIISGGQTMNPSTDDILKAVLSVGAETVYVFPNNGNIIMAADQAALLAEDRKVVVVPTKTICEGITCMANYVPSDPEKVTENFKEALTTVQTVEVTYAVRDTVIDGTEIHKDDYMALAGKSVVSVGTDLKKVVHDAVEKLVTDDSFMVTLYYGADITDEEAEETADSLSDVLKDADIQAVKGGQPVYYYMISVES